MDNGQPPRPRSERIVEKESIPFELPPFDVERVKERLFAYEATPEGFAALCKKVEQSPDPEDIQLILFLAAPPVDEKTDKQFSAGQYFGCPTSKLFSTLSQIKKGNRPIQSVVDACVEKHPRIIPTFLYEFLGYWLKYDAGELHDIVVPEQEKFYESKEKRSGDFLLNVDHAFWEVALSFEDQFHRIFRYLKSFSIEQLHQFIRRSVEYLVAGGPHITNASYTRLMNGLDPAYATRCFLDEWKKRPQASIREKHASISSLSQLDAPPGKIVGNDCEYLGLHIQLIDTPPNATTAKSLSVYGEIGVFDDTNTLIGLFSLHDIETQTPEQTMAKVRPLTGEDLFFRYAESTPPTQEQEAVREAFAHEYDTYAKHDFFIQCEIPLQALPLKEQAALIRFLQNEDVDFQQVVARESRGLLPVLRTCALSYAHVGNCDALFETDENMQPPKKIRPVIGEYYGQTRKLESSLEVFTNFVDHAEQTARLLHAELLEQYPDMELAVDDIIHSLITGALHALGDMQDIPSRERYREQVLQYRKDVAVGVSVFREITQLGEQKRIDLFQYARRRDTLQKFMEKNPALAPVMIDTLIQTRHAKPAPKLFWRIDRRVEEYNERTGISTVGFLRDIAEASPEPNKRQLLLELGAGAGVGMFELLSQLSPLYRGFSLNDEAYYSLIPPLKQCIDVDSLGLSPQEADRFIDFIHKTLYVAKGKGAEDAIDDFYDHEFMEALEKDPNHLKEALVGLGEKLYAAPVMPSDFAIQPQPDGSAHYTQKVSRDTQSLTLQQALDRFAQNPSQYLHSETMNVDLKQYLQVHPLGMIVAKFSEIGRFAPDQIRAALAVRSTVYLPRPDYVQFLGTLFQKLKSGGAYQGDCVRENFGRYYRLRQLLEAQKHLPSSSALHLTIGPGVSGDDYNQKQAIRGVVLTKGDFDERIIQRNIVSPRYHVRSLDDVVHDKKYLRTLYDRSGQKYVDEILELL